MFALLGWVLIAGLPLSSSFSTDGAFHPPARRSPVAAPGRVSVWTGQDEPYRRGQGARVYLAAEGPAHVTVFRVDTDGRLTVLFPREPWGDTYLREAREFEVTGGRGGRSFIVDDHPGVGYLFAIASAQPFDFDDIVRGDYWDYRLIEGGGRIRGDPYVVLTDLAARIAPGGNYDYDINPYYVEQRYDYPRFVCYDCHAYAEYDEWDPYRQACARFRMVIYDDPRFYPYRGARGRNVVMPRPARPGPRYVFRDADPRRQYVTRVQGSETVERRGDGAGRTSEDVGGRGSVPAPAMSSARRTPRVAPPLRAIPSRRPAGEGTPEGAPGGRRRTDPVAPQAAPQAAPKGLAPADDTRRPAPAAKPRREPQSTGEPELRRRKP